MRYVWLGEETEGRDRLILTLWGASASDDSKAYLLCERGRAREIGIAG
jgi:hypothetical protein